ncbi:MAG: hypothetical protein N2578_02595, partial [Bdellovibrionaceae bacterium]|nr:hypothetical protein [Pseudobdellovibrionaceae bacterium]
LLFYDRELDIEIYAEHLCRSPVHAEAIFTRAQDPAEFLRKIDFPDHAVIVRPFESKTENLFKGLVSEEQVRSAIKICADVSCSGQAVVFTDLRAHLNKTRRKAIRKAGEELIKKLQSFCPAC